ncbi:PH domain-containing protein [Streptomyces glomeratus]|uniref:PH domain-containing protein n=1 Tax=Streptomyces glomeratus TaxID=284452 RepID=A0ABP6LBV1_9ACTN|nr:PH domain-containing protein [Streptomyces glomeratus]MCF1508758.1 PH domain-containing protein [Streptomyces glomeratus]
MINNTKVNCRPRGRRTLWFFVGLGASGAVAAVVRVAYRGRVLDVWPGLGLLLALMGVASLHWVVAQVSADAYGLHSRTLLRRRSVPWGDVADLRVRLRHANTSRIHDSRRVILVLRDGHKRLLPLPRSWASDDPDFDATLEALRALHRRHGAPESSHLSVVSYRTAGHGWLGSLALCVLLLAGAGVSAWWVPRSASDERAWQSATPCAAETPGTDRGGSRLLERDREHGRDCLSTVPAVIARVEARQPKQRSLLYFTGSRPLERLEVSYEAAEDFQAGDRVQLTVWRGRVTKVSGEGHVWREHITTPGELAVIAALLTLAAGYPGALLLLRLRGRRLPDDEVLPSALPFAAVLAGTALWLLPLCHLHPTAPLSSPVTATWAAVGSLATAGLFVWAWRATRVRMPGSAGTGAAGTAEESAEESAEGQEEVFLAARFLEDTDYNPHGFGTHIVIGGGDGPAVTPHPGPGRFAARRIPVERLTVKNVRRVRGGDGDTVSRSWHIAELDDAGEPVRLAAAPADLTRIIRELAVRPPTPPAVTHHTQQRAK